MCFRPTKTHAVKYGLKQQGLDRLISLNPQHRISTTKAMWVLKAAPIYYQTTGVLEQKSTTLQDQLTVQDPKYKRQDQAPTSREATLNP